MSYNQQQVLNDNWKYTVNQLYNSYKTIIYSKIKIELGEKITMNVFKLFIIILGAILRDVYGLGINLTQTQILGNLTHYRIQLSPFGDNPPFVLQFPRFPAQWNQTDKYMIVPKITTATWNQYLVSVVLKDKIKTQYKISLIFLMNYQALAMDTTVYDFYATPASLGLSNINLSNLKDLINQQIDDFPIRNILDEAKLKKLPNLKLEQVFNNIINPKIIKAILSQGNLPVLIKSIFNILKKNLSCLQNLAYLQEISTIAKQVLSQKSSKLEESESLYLQENGQIENKSEEKSMTNTMITESQLKELQERQISVKIKYYSVTESYMKKLDEEWKVRQLIKNQQRNLKQLQSQRDKLNQIIQQQQDKKKLFTLSKNTVNSSNLRSQLDDKLKKTLTTIEILNRSFNQLTNNITQISKNLEQLYNSTDRIQKQISDIEILIDKIQRDLSEVNLKLFTIKTNITQKYSPQLPMSPYLQAYFKTMPVAFNFVVHPLYFINFRTQGELTSIADGRAELFILQSIKRYLDRMVDKIYYDCYGIKNVQETDQIGLYLYKIPYSQFINYINKFYLGNSSDKYILSKDNLSKQKIQLRRADLLPTVVTKRLSDAFNSSQIEPIDKIQQLQQGMSCKAPAVLQSFVGIIKSIKDNIYEVKIPRLQNFFVLKGVCTRVEISGDESAGKILFWRGVQISDKIYDAYFILIM